MRKKLQVIAMKRNKNIRRTKNPILEAKEGNFFDIPK
jgi:hypothetical protein